MLVELRQAGSEALLDRMTARMPPPVAGCKQRSKLVLQRRHYTLRNGRYEIASVALIVKPQVRPADAQRWRMVADPECRFNARSPLLRCAVWPADPDTCAHRETR